MPDKTEEKNPVLVLAMVMILVLLINMVVFPLNRLLGIMIIPFSVFSVFFFLVRLIAPAYLKRRVVRFLDRNNGEAEVGQVIIHLALSRKPGQTQANEATARAVIKRLEEERVIRVEGDMIRKVLYNR